MKKLIIILTLVSLMLVSANVQASGYGVRAGLNFTFFSSNEVVVDDRMIEVLSDAYTGFHIGGVGYLSFLNIFIQPELLYSQTGQEISVRMLDHTDFPDSSTMFYTKRFHNISIPVLAGIEFGPLRVGLGPVATFMLNSPTIKDDLLEGIEFEYNTASLGYQAMAGLKLGSLMLDLKYQGGFSKFGDGVNLAGQNFDFETSKRQFLISLGILLN